MSDTRSHQIVPILQALLVTFLWSTSFIIIKWGLSEIHPITYAGMRYFLAFLCFIPFYFKPGKFEEIKSLSGPQWRNLVLLGVVFYTLTQGTQFLGLSLLPAVTVSLMLNFTPLVVALVGIPLLNEKPAISQWVGAIIFISGVLFYFFPVDIGGSRGLGLAVMSFGVIANAGSAIIGRGINRKKDLSVMTITFVSMGIGSILLLAIGIGVSGFPVLSLKSWGYLLWLAVINTAFAFTLWNHTLRTLSAMESSIINGTMLIQIAILAWVFLGESITLMEGLGMFIAAVGAFLVQTKRKADTEKGKEE